MELLTIPTKEPIIKKDVVVEETVTDLCKCGEPAEIGCHGIANSVVYSESWCEKCYNKRYK